MSAEPSEELRKRIKAAVAEAHGYIGYRGCIAAAQVAQDHTDAAVAHEQMVRKELHELHRAEMALAEAVAVKAALEAVAQEIENAGVHIGNAARYGYDSLACRSRAAGYQEAASIAKAAIPETPSTEPAEPTDAEIDAIWMAEHGWQVEIAGVTITGMQENVERVVSGYLSSLSDPGLTVAPSTEEETS